ncbi:hypothetical protein FJZ18_01975 [Candidatus Pacearchaeota archaeon]|nr:hypothetical protein [Candidatus Pacearchaeota archaeon]
MGLFRKESGDIIDFTMLQKRGLLKKEEVPSSNVHIDNRTGFIDLTPPIPSSQSPVTTNDNQPQDLFGFLESKSGDTSSSSLPEPPQSKEFEHLKVKIDDLEYKIDRLLEKIAFLESKVSSS